MERKVIVFASWLLLLTTVGALRTCVDVQNTLMACVFSSDVDILGETGQHNDIAQLCWHTSVLLECVDEARSTCPNLPILSDPDFAYAIRNMETQWDTYCSSSGTTQPVLEQTTSGSMLGDQAESCDPVAAMIKCNEIMAGVDPGDIKAMCIPGDDYLACMTQIVDSCPAHAEVLPFDLQEAIDTTRAILQRECPVVEEDHTCAERIESAKRGCADFLTDGNGDYCRSLMTYMDCLKVTLTSCPDPDLQSLLSNQYHHHCAQAFPMGRNSGGSPRCPDDVEAAMMDCSVHVDGVENSDKATFCRKSEKYLLCVEDLFERCKNDTRFALLPSDPSEQMRQQITALCSPQDEEKLPQPRARTRYPLRTLKRPNVL